MPRSSRAITDDSHVVGTALEAPDPVSLARFYSDLLGWPIAHQEPGTSILAVPEGPIYIVFQQASDYQAPVWPAVRWCAAADDALRLPGRRPRFGGR